MIFFLFAALRFWYTFGGVYVREISMNTRKRVVLVGTYKGDQLTRWGGWYNYPVSEDDFSRVEQEDRVDSGSAALRRGRECTGGASSSPTVFSEVNELWLFRGTATQRNYRAEFVGIKTREELVRDYGYPGDDLSRAETQRRGDGRGKRPACPKPHGTHYALFKTEFLYPHEGGDPEEADAVIVRVGDFAKRSPKIAKQLKAYLESPDRRNPDLAKRLPRILTRLRPEQLRVCEEAVQLSFWDLPQMKSTMQSLIPFPRKENPSFTFIDLFAGVGGIRMGFQDAGGECVFSSEWNTEAARTYQMNFGEYPQGDITKIPTEAIPDFDVLLAGFPCQPFSISGKMKGFSDTRGTLFFEVCRIIAAKKPKVVFLENVKHLVHHDNGRTLDVILRKLSEFGYKVSWKVLNGSDFGVPQNRERIIIVGSCDATFDFSKISTLPKTVLRDFLDESGDFEFLQPCEYTLINHPRRQEDSGLIFAGYRNKSIRKVGVRPNTLHLSRVHKQPNRIYSVDGIHPTLPSQESSGRYFILTHENAVRKLTIDECWRIMGFPSQFVRPSAIGEQYRQLGNSVCVPMIRIVAKEVVHQLLEGRNEKETRCNS